MKICILGSGAFAISLGLVLSDNKHEVVLWTKFADEANYLNRNRMSPTLPNVVVDEEIKVSTNLEESINNSELIIVAVPAGAVRSVFEEASKYIINKQHICIASKGIEQETCKFVSDVIEEYIPVNNLCVISGPTFAIDVANKVPVGLSIASKNNNTIDIVKSALQNNYVKLRETNDIIGVELCGSIKNVMAIASGMLAGMNLPISNQAMLITELANDIKHLIDDLHGDPKTIASFAGFGDILLTCTSPKSRNFTLGKLIGSKSKKKEITNYIKTNTIEGLYTLASISKLIKMKNIDMPIINILNDIIYNDRSVEDLLTFLIEKK